LNQDEMANTKLWEDVIKILEETVCNFKGAKREEFKIRCIAAHISIALLFEGKITDEIYANYAAVIERYIDAIGNAQSVDIF